MLSRFFNWRSLFLLMAMAIVLVTVLYTRYLSGKIEKEERQRVEEWVLANQALQASENPASIALANAVIVNNEDMPLIATNEQGDIIDHRNVDSTRLAADSQYLFKLLDQMKEAGKPIRWQISDSPSLVYNVYFGNTRLQSEVKYYPLVQLVVVALFMALLLSLLTTQNKSRQNQVWAGMAKETAHQLGTPISSLQGWVEMLREKYPDDHSWNELDKDINRLKTVSDRFGKIGSLPVLEPTNLAELADEMIGYMKQRAPGKVQFEWARPDEPFEAPASATLINWVLENLLKNALDALEGSGRIKVELSRRQQQIVLDITDTGKGIPAALIGRVFEPGFTTKKRGWGLGLTLSRRIVQQYHGGQLFVKSSEPGVGTTFRMVLPASA